jgi:sodium-dependent dicarboxylate transporter 2/3/5
LVEVRSERLDGRQRLGLVLGPLLFVLLLLVPFGERSEIHRCAAVGALMATWWITEAIPIAATSLLPLVLFPLLGVLSSADTAREFANDPIFLFIGGFILALAVERWGLHRRIALAIIGAVGDSPRRLVLGFMVAAALLSMWISNTATAMMMLPIGLSVTALAQRRSQPGQSVGIGAFCAAVMLAIAYGSSIGGTATLIGTPPNIVFQERFAAEFPHGPDITFFRWMQIGLPVAVVFFAVAYLVLTRLVFNLRGLRGFGGAEVLSEERESLGPMTRAERRVAVILATTALLWIWRSDVDTGLFVIPGWSTLLAKLPFMHLVNPETHKSLLHDATVAMAAAVLLFLVPAGDGTGRRLMNWETAERIPYGILFLFGGGFALAKGFQVSGLSAWLGHAFSESPLTRGSPLLLVAGVSTGVTFLTELTSNTATAQMILPLLSSLARLGADLNPLVLMVPATLSASFAFMLPVATPPNAIVFSSGQVRMMDMVRAGFILNLIGIALTVGMSYFLVRLVFHITPAPFPAAWLPG